MWTWLGLLAHAAAAPRESTASPASPAGQSRTTPNSLFAAGLEAYRAGDFDAAAEAFGRCALEHPSAGAWQNLGNAEWRRGRLGPAIVAWERALWIDPRDARSRNNLRFVREQAQLEAPELRWHEIASTWLP
ncbi:MAG TPA: tetratricopeptide repeat protein, partial [Verrucomicrobiota bacterium]|nr:tetratricopeptide repeat protein [Verrucomicrobiota bacterium]